MNKLELLRTKLEQARKELNEKGYHYDSEMYSKGGYNELMKIKPFEIKYQDVIEEIWPDEAWWKVTNYWDIFDAMAFEGLNDEQVIDEIIKHVDSSFLDESFKIDESLDKELKELENKYNCKFEEGHTHAEYEDTFGEEYDNGELWDYSLEDIKTGAVEPQKGLVYWLIADRDDETRVFETTEFCEECSESCKSLKEGTSNFGWLRIFPLLVFYTYDEIEGQVRAQSDYPSIEQFTTDKGNGDFHVDYDAYYDACDKFEQDYWDKIETAVLDEDQVEALEDAIYDFNEETLHIAENLYDAENEDDYYVLKDIKLKIEPGYYEAAYIDVDDERDFDSLSDKVREEQLKRFKDFFEKLKNEHHLSHYEVAWGPASNGETGYRKVESIEEEYDDGFEDETVTDIICNVLDDYGITYGDVVEYEETDTVNIVGVLPEEYDEVREAIETELDCEVSLPSGEEYDDEIIVHISSLKESKKEEALKESNKEVMSTEEFLAWHDGEGGRNASSAVLDNIYKIFEENGDGEDVDVDVCYEHLPENRKAEVTSIIKATMIEENKKDCHVNTNAGDPVKNAEFFNASMGTSGEGSVGEDLEESKKEDKSLDDIDADKDDKKELAKQEYEKEVDDADADRDDKLEKEESLEEDKSKEQINEDLIVTTNDVTVHVDPTDAVTTIESSEGSVVVQHSNGDVTVNTDSGVTVNTSEGVTDVDVNKVEEVTAEVETDIVSTPEDEKNMITGDEMMNILDKGIDVNTGEVQDESLKEANHVCEKCGKEVCECDKQELKEEPVYNLDTRYDSRDSFYGKAKVDIRDDGSQILYSYSTPVCYISKDGEVKLLRKGYLGWFSSPTTLRHVKEFLKQNGKEVGTKNELNKMYSTEDAYNYVK